MQAIVAPMPSNLFVGVVAVFYTKPNFDTILLRYANFDSKHENDDHPNKPCHQHCKSATQVIKQQLPVLFPIFSELIDMIRCHCDEKMHKRCHNETNRQTFKFTILVLKETQADAYTCIHTAFANE